MNLIRFEKCIFISCLSISGLDIQMVRHSARRVFMSFLWAVVRWLCTEFFSSCILKCLSGFIIFFYFSYLIFIFNVRYHNCSFSSLLMSEITDWEFQIRHLGKKNPLKGQCSTGTGYPERLWSALGDFQVLARQSLRWPFLVLVIAPLWVGIDLRALRRHRCQPALLSYCDNAVAQ